MKGPIRQICRLAVDWPASLLGGWRHRHDFRELESYCFFIGHPRSGHSIVGGLLDAAIDYYFGLCETISRIRAQLAADEIFELSHEAFVEDPGHYLDRLWRFLGVEAEPDYLDTCTSVVRPTPHRSREAILWPRESTDRVMRLCREFTFLDAYTNREPDHPS